MKQLSNFEKFKTPAINGLDVWKNDKNNTCKDKELFIKLFMMALEKDSNGFCLFSKKINIIPKEISFLTNIRTLAFPANEIEVLPDEICSLPHLSKIDISINKIKQFPLKLLKMKTLLKICINYNPLETFPEPKDVNGKKTIVISQEHFDKFKKEVKKLKNKATFELPEDN